ncbi:MAG: anti-sigma factor family protein [Acidobacteriota bacterium]
MPSETLDQYATGKLEDESCVAAVEEHLLVCHECQDRLAELDRFIATLRAAVPPRPKHQFAKGS